MSGTTEPAHPARAYLDSNVFIRAVERTGPLSDMLIRILSMEGAEPYLVTSELTLAELLVLPFRLGREDLISQYENWVSANSTIDVVPVTRAVLRDAARVRSRIRSLKLPDAIHVTTACQARCRYFLTDDKRIQDYAQVVMRRVTKVDLGALIQVFEARARPAEPGPGNEL